MGGRVTPKKSLEDIVAEYTEDLMANRRPRLSEDIAALDESEREQLGAMLALMRRLKAAHREAPPPREEFVQHLDRFVREEIGRQSLQISEAAEDAARPLEEFRSAGKGRSLLDRILATAKRLVGASTFQESGARWRLVAAAALMLLLGLQVLLYLHIRRLEQQNQVLAARLEQVRPSGSFFTLQLPRNAQAGRGKEIATPGPPYLDTLVEGLELRMRIEHRIRELEREAATKTGRDRELAESALRELRAILQPTQNP
jgi:hypothetical protein